MVNKESREADIKAIIKKFLMEYNKANKRPPLLKEIIGYVLQSEAPSFYITEETARIALSDSVQERKGNRAKMYSDIQKKIELLKTKGATKSQIISEVLNGNAPSFYVSERTVLKVWRDL